MGRQPVFRGALLLFALGLGVMVVSPDMGIFTLGFAMLTGLAAAALVSTPLALMDHLYDDVAEQYGLLALTVSGVAGSLIGSLIGGLMAFQLSWRWAFGLELGLIPIIWLLVRRVSIPLPARTMPIDWVGGLLSVGGFGLPLMGLSLSGEYGWWQPKGGPQPLDFLLAPFGISIVPLLITAGLICLGLLAFWQRQRSRQGEAPLWRMGVFSRRIYIIGLTIGTLHTMISAGVQFNLFQFIPPVVGLNPFQTAIAVIPYTIAQLVVLVLLVKRRPQFPPRYLLQVGLAVKSVGIAMLFAAVSTTIKPLGLLPSLVMMGIGTGLFVTYITSLTFSATAEDEKAEARGVYRPFQNLGASLGRGILGTLLVALASLKIVDGIIAELGQSVSSEVRRNAIRSLQVAVQTMTRDERSTLFDQLPERIQPSLDGILTVSSVEAMKATLLVILILSLVCLGLSFLLPKTAKKFEAPIE
ncbi:MAG: MFS transporter [Leptolyngbyaceae cyanobacterium SM2_3_12]|nr:MFS transporter [Leptolyngbyaceae cyanobacterium SM2_3_12]